VEGSTLACQDPANARGSWPVQRGPCMPPSTPSAAAEDVAPPPPWLHAGLPWFGNRRKRACRGQHSHAPEAPLSWRPGMSKHGVVQKPGASTRNPDARAEQERVLWHPHRRCGREADDPSEAKNSEPPTHESAALLQPALSLRSHAFGSDFVTTGWIAGHASTSSAPAPARVPTTSRPT